MMYGFGAGWWWMGLIWPLLIGSLIWAIARGTARPATTNRALETLADRYARGEIDRTEYETRKTDIEGR